MGIFAFIVSVTLGIYGMLTDGSEIRLVSPNLATVYSTAKVGGRTLQFESLPPAGAEIRVLVFPPDGANNGEQDALASPQAFRGVVAVSEDDILIYINNKLTSFRLTLLEEYGVRLRLPGD